MWNKMIEWLNVRDNVTFLIAVASFALSIWNFFSDWIKNRKNISVKIKNVFSFGPDSDGDYTEVLNICIVNKSREGIVLTGFEVSCAEKTNRYGEYRYELKKCSEGNKTLHRETSRSRWFSDLIPAKIEGLGYVHLLVASTGSLKCIEENQECHFVISTNKGKIRGSFTSDFSNAGMLSQCREPDLYTEGLL